MIWKEIKISDGKYSVSETGLIKRNNSSKLDKYKRTRIVNEKILKPCLVGKGYLSVSLRIKNKTIKFYVHRLVAIEFVENKYLLPEVNHKDLQKKNNHYKNLEWVNKRENSNHYHNSKNPGVTVCKNGKFRVRAMINGKRICLGTFDKIEDANNEYKRKTSQI